MSQAEQCYCEAQKQCPDKAEFISSKCTVMEAGLAGTFAYFCRVKERQENMNNFVKVYVLYH